VLKCHTSVLKMGIEYLSQSSSFLSHTYY